ncbi:MAG: amidophosphoribosyltransferase [Candidatus Cloacimonetes bacterium]|nr:amidophosphoribosyltransferase [Candidatus Cloacimonadota bacterium]
MCGIVGVYNHNHAAILAANAMFAEQHRGQESCGIAVSDGKVIRLRKRMGLVKEVFTPEELEKLHGHIAIGHVRYPTRGTSTEFNSQPHVVETLAGPCYSLASNGDIVNYHEMRQILEDKGVYFASSNDGELILKYIIYKVEYEQMSIVDAIKCCMRDIKGAYSTVLATRYELYMFRDPYGFRPMSIGKTEDNSFVVASETCALDIVKAKFISCVNPAEIIVINDKGIRNIENDPNEYRTVDYAQHCIFEHIYFSRPDSYQFQEDVFSVRERIGVKLALMDNDFMPDLVVPVPDSSNFIASGYANFKKMPVTFGLIRNHYSGRTFIKSEQSIRDESVSHKFNVLPHTFKDKIVVLIDDSMVRGTTIKKIIAIINQAGAKEVHLRLGSPKVKYSCFYGIDTPNKDDLISNRLTIEQILDDFKITSIKHIDLDSLLNCVCKPEHYCHACFSGKYPIE